MKDVSNCKIYISCKCVCFKPQDVRSYMQLMLETKLGREHQSNIPHQHIIHQNYNMCLQEEVGRELKDVNVKL